MSRKFHNLAGWLRDLQAARAAGPEGDGDAYALWTAFVDEVEFALEEIEGPDPSGGGESSDAEDGDADASDELDGDDTGSREDGIPEPRRHDAGGPLDSTPASMLDAVLDRLAGPERARAVAELDQLRRDAVAGAEPQPGSLVKLPRPQVVKRGT